MEKITDALLKVGGVLLLLGAAAMITRWSFAPYIYCAGAIMFCFAQMATEYPSDTLTIRRLRGQLFIANFFLLLTGVLMFAAPLHAQLLVNHTLPEGIRSFLISLTRRNSWIGTLCIAALFELYASFRLDHELSKE